MTVVARSIAQLTGAVIIFVFIVLVCKETGIINRKIEFTVNILI